MYRITHLKAPCQSHRTLYSKHPEQDAAMDKDTKMTTALLVLSYRQANNIFKFTRQHRFQKYQISTMNIFPSP